MTWNSQSHGQTNRHISNLANNKRTRRSVLESTGASIIGLTGSTVITGARAASDTNLNPDFVKASVLGDYNSTAYDSLQVRLLMAEHDDGKVSIATAEDVFDDVTTTLRRIISASELEGAVVTLFDTDADFSGLNRQREHFNRADRLLWGTPLDNLGGNNIWLQPNHGGISYPARYEPSVYRPDYQNATRGPSSPDFPHSFSPEPDKNDGLHWVANHENLHNMIRGALTGDMEGGCAATNNIHTLASEHVEEIFGIKFQLSTLMARPSNDALECGTCSVDKSEVDYHGLYPSECEVEAINRTIRWARENNR